MFPMSIWLRELRGSQNSLGTKVNGKILLRFTDSGNLFFKRIQMIPMRIKKLRQNMARFHKLRIETSVWFRSLLKEAAAIIFRKQTLPPNKTSRISKKNLRISKRKPEDDADVLHSKHSLPNYLSISCSIEEQAPYHMMTRKGSHMYM